MDVEDSTKESIGEINRECLQMTSFYIELKEAKLVDRESF